MNEETKDKAKDVAKELTQNAAEWLKEEAKSSTGLMRWVWGILALLAMGVCAWLGTGCEYVSPAQIHAAHELYHVLSEEPCILVVEGEK